MTPGHGGAEDHGRLIVQGTGPARDCPGAFEDWQVGRNQALCLVASTAAIRVPVPSL